MAEELYEHLTGHVGPREPWICRWTVCRNPANVGRHWPYRSSLLQHLPHECPHCGYRTTFQWRLATHLRKHELEDGSPAAQSSQQQRYAMPNGDGRSGALALQPRAVSDDNAYANDEDEDDGDCFFEEQGQQPQQRRAGRAAAHLAQVLVVDGAGKQCGDPRQVVVTDGDTVGTVVAAIEREVLPVGCSVAHVWRCTSEGLRVLIDSRQYGYAFDLMSDGCAVAVDYMEPAGAVVPDNPASEEDANAGGDAPSQPPRQNQPPNPNAPEEDPPLAADTRARLATSPDAVVAVGTTPEGLPMLLSVRRSLDLRSAVASALGLSGGAQSIVPEGIAAPFAALSRAVHRHCCGVGVTQIDGCRTYVTSKQVCELMGQPVLAALLGVDSPLKQSSKARAPQHLAGTFGLRAKPLVTSVEFLGGVDRGGYNATEVTRQLSGTVHVGVPLDDQRPTTVVRVARDEEPSTRKVAEWEDLRALRGATWRCPVADARGRPTVRTLTGRIAEEHAGLVAAIAALQSPAVTYCVTRQSVGEAVAQLGRSLYMLHEVGEVHGDVCPVNTLLLSTGAKMIDALRIRTGTIAFAGTPGWCAPEQALYKPVTPAADVYPLGLMLVKLLSACIYGEERKYILPTSQDASKRVRLLPDPSILIDTKKIDMHDESARAAWKAFIERCVAFEPERRPANGSVFADELDALMAKFPLPGALENAYRPPGELMPGAVVNGTTGPVRVVFDTYSSVRSAFD
eukprot:m51a1_g9603 putative serine threonine protein kinase (738) ;mRNA; f:1051590-1055143